MTTFCKTSLKILWIIISFILSCDGQETHLVTNYSAPQAVVIGSNFTFEWTYVLADQDKLKSITLQFNSSRTLLIYVVPNIGVDVNSINAKYKGRITWTGDLTKSVVSFVLSNVALADETEYNIKIKYNAISVLQNVVNLKVQVPPKITSISGNKTVKEGGPFELTCGADGQPDPSITWTKGGMQRSHNKTFKVLASNRNDAGEYVCAAENKLSKDTSSVQITVQYSPEGTTLTTSASSDTAVEGENVILTCGVTDAMPLVDMYRFSVKKDGVLTTFPDSQQKTHHLSSVKGSDQGTYKCVPHNAVGDGKEATVKLTVNVPPKITSISGDKTVKEGDSFQLTCGADGQPNPTITWTKGGTQVSHKKTFKVLASNRSDAGEYVCTAENLLSKVTSSVQITVQYKAKIDKAASSSNMASWIGQKVSLTCVTDGVPVPSVTWTKPGGSQLKRETSKTSRVNLDLATGADFGEYNCSADNGFPSADVLTVRLDQITKPGSPTVTISNEDIQATSLTIRWTPSNNGGSAISGYRVRVLGTEFNKNYTNATSISVIEPLRKNTSYTLEVYAKNVAGEGLPARKTFSTKDEGAPDAVIITVSSTGDPRTYEVGWTEPINNGAAITSYKIYKRVFGTNEYIRVHTLSKNTLSYNISLDPLTSYEIVVTATNKFGESVEGNGRKVDVPEVTTAITRKRMVTTPAGRTAVGDKSGSGMIIGVAIGAVLFAVVAVALGFLLWRKRKNERSKGPGRASSRDALSSDDESYASVGGRPSVRNLVAGAEGSYADMGSSVYAQVDKTKKKANKPKRKPGEPGELMYADLADFSRPRGGAVPVRPEEIQLADYADITQFSAPKQEPTYDNLPRGDTTYANVQAR